MIKSLSNLYRGTKAFAKLCAARAKKEHIPWYLFLLITDRCNMFCKYCDVESPKRAEDTARKKKEWTTEEIFKIIEDFYALGTRYINFQGGEPLLRNDIEKLIDYANKKGMVTDIFTNGLLIHRNINALKKLSRITISLEGDEKTHDTDRGKGTYQKILRNIELLSRNNITFTINYTVTPTNACIDSVKHVLEIARRYNSLVGIGEAVLKFDPALAEFIIPKERLKTFWKGVKYLKMQGYPLQKSIKSIDFCINSIDYITGMDVYDNAEHILHMDKKDILPCAMGRYCAYLDVNGKLYPCSNKFGKIGKSIYEAGAKAAWQYLNKNITCNVCRDSISGGVNYFCYLDFNTVKEATKHFMRIYLRPPRAINKHWGFKNVEQ